ncbi:MAG: radical SAM protein [Deltaproteobacteria bacterium]
MGKAVRQPGYAIRVALKRLRAYAAYKNADGRGPAPEAITFFLTRLCNLRCRMCGQWGDKGVTKQEGGAALADALPQETVGRVLEEVEGFHPNITLFGGEPLLHPAILPIMKSVKEKDLHGLVITNGTLLDRFAVDLVTMGWDELNISVDGDGALHDEIRGLPGVFGRIMNGIREVNAAKKELGRKKPLINLQCTVTRYNYERLETLLDVAREAQADSLTFHNLIFVGRKALDEHRRVDAMLGCSSRAWEGFVFDPGIDPKKLFVKMQQVLGRPAPFSVDFYPNFTEKGLVEYYMRPDYLPSEYAPRCMSPWVCAYVFPDGGVRPCLNCSFAFGNVKETEFLKIWNSPDAVRYRQALKKEGIFPACRRCTELYRY